MSEPRRVLIDWDYGACGIWWVLTREEMEAPAPPGEWSGRPPPGHGMSGQGPWSDLLPAELLDDLRAWNDACEGAGGEAAGLREQGRDLAVRVQAELGTDGWEVLYRLGGRMHRVHPPGRWPAGSWQQDLLGYSRRTPR